MSDKCETRHMDGDGGFDHCVHERPGQDSICCWCGDLFLSDEDYEPDHGPYVPEDKS